MIGALRQQVRAVDDFRACCNGCDLASVFMMWWRMRIRSVHLSQTNKRATLARSRESESPLITILLVLPLFQFGCSSTPELPRRPIHGTIVGAEDRNGELLLIPPAQAKAPAASTPILNGKYKFDKSTGPVPGQYDVIVRLRNETSAERTIQPPINPSPKTGGFSLNAGQAIFDEFKPIALTVAKDGDLKMDIRVSKK